MPDKTAEALRLTQLATTTVLTPKEAAKISLALLSANVAPAAKLIALSVAVAELLGILDQYGHDEATFADVLDYTDPLRVALQ